MQVKKLLTLFALLGMTATSMAQVTTFNLIGGSNDDWVIDSYTNLNTEGRIWQTNPGEKSYVIFQATEATYIQGYTIKLNKLSVNNENNYIESGLPYTWTLYGSNDKDDDNSWVLIHSQVQANRVKEDYDNGFFKSAGKSYTYYCNSKTQYLYYKFKVTGKFGGTWGGFKMARLDLIPSSVGFSASGNGMDGDTSTKQEGNSFPQTITVTGSASTRITGFQFTTGNDNTNWPGRNPRTIKVEGSSDNTNWTTLLLLENYTGMEDKNYYPYVFDIDGSHNYQYYKFSFSDVTAQWNYFQISELAIITPLQISTPAHLANFASLVNTGTTGVDAILTDNIDYTAYTTGFIGTDGNRYSGTFDGQGHTVTTDIKTTVQGTGFFGSINGATIKNLVLDGSIESSRNWIGGIGGISRGDATKIQNVVVKSTIKYTGSGDSTCGGLFGDMENAFTVENCAFLGSIDVGSGTNVGGLVSWTGSGTFTNCLAAPTEITAGSQGDFVSGGAGTFSNCYKVAHNDAKLASGELCYLLNGSVNAGTNWYQDLSGTEAYPSPFGSKTVSAGQWFSNSDDVYYNLEGGNYTVYQLNLNEDNTKYDVPANVTAINVTMSRKLKAGVWNTFCSPVNIDKNYFSAIKKLTGVAVNGDNYTMTFSDETGDNLVAGKPYMVQVSSAKSELTTTDANVATSPSSDTSNGLTFNGVFTSGNAPEGSFIISNNVFYNVDSAVTLGAFRGYITVGGGSSVKALNFTFDDDADGISPLLTFPEEEERVYNLAGQRLNKAQKGINIVNGRKVLF